MWRIFAMLVVTIALVAFLPAMNVANLINSSPPAQEITWQTGAIEPGTYTNVDFWNATISDGVGQGYTFIGCTGSLRVVESSAETVVTIQSSDYLFVFVDIQCLVGTYDESIAGQYNYTINQSTMTLIGD